MDIRPGRLTKYLLACVMMDQNLQALLTELMRLAFFTSIVPDGAATTGFEIANDAILSGLREMGHTVVVIGFKLPRQRATGQTDVIALEVRELENSAVGAVGKLVWLAQAVRYGLPYAAAKLADFSSHALDDVIALAGPFDGYILNSYQMATAFPQLQEVPHVYVAHNVEHQSAVQNALAVGSRLQRWLYQRDARLLKPLEEKFCRDASFVWTFSEADVVGHNLTAEQGCLLPLIVPKGGGRRAAADKKFDAGLIGTWSWQPNFVGLKWFAEEVGPLLPASMKIAVAGSVPETALEIGSQFSFLGRVDSAESFLNSVHIVPLVSRGGTGVQLKTIEAFQAGHPCIATASSLRGIDDIPPNCRKADNPAEFADALVQLVELSKSGQLPTVDGSEFFAKQKSAMDVGLKRGIASLES